MAALMDSSVMVESRTRQIKKMNPNYFGADVDSISIESGPSTLGSSKLMSLDSGA
jgi:hypothetical protein